MPKKKLKPGFYASVTRSGRNFADRKPVESSAANPDNTIPIQILADALATSSALQPLSGIRSKSSLSDSPVSPLLARTTDEKRWKEDETTLESELRQNETGNPQLEIGNDGFEDDNSGDNGNNRNMSSEANLDEILETVETGINVAEPLIPFSVLKCTLDARSNVTKKPVSVAAVPPAAQSPDVPHSAPTAKPTLMHTKPSYASCFTSLPRCAGTYTPREFFASQEDPIPPTEIVQEGVNLWKDHLVGFFLDSNVPYIDVREHCRKAWNIRGGLRVNYMNGMFYFKFLIMEERIKVLESDPAIIGGKPFIITSWSTMVENAREHVPSIPVWTIFTRIPTVLQTLPGLNWLASRIGKFKCFDADTESRKNLIFAKALIEITPSKPLPKKLKVSIHGFDSFVDVQYSWQPDICTKCQSFGHLLETCKLEGISKVRTPLRKPPPSIWVQKNKVVDKLVEEVPTIVKELKSNATSGNEDLMDDRDVSSDEEIVDDGIDWNSNDRSWEHGKSGMRYDPYVQEYYKYVTDLEDDMRRLEYKVVGDSFELIQEGELGDKNSSLFHDSSWDWDCEFRSPNTCFVPNLAVLFFKYINVRGSDSTSETTSYSSLAGE